MNFVSTKVVVQIIKNDRIWAIELDNIPKNVQVRQSSKHPACIRIFLLFSVKKMLWVVKDEGQK